MLPGKQNADIYNEDFVIHPDVSNLAKHNADMIIHIESPVSNLANVIMLTLRKRKIKGNKTRARPYLESEESIKLE